MAMQHSVTKITEQASRHNDLQSTGSSNQGNMFVHVNTNPLKKNLLVQFQS